MSSPRPIPAPAEIVAFWLEAGPEKWFSKDAAFDAEITARFGQAHQRAAAGELAHWEDEPEGALALILLLDQFPRNMFRDDAAAFATDPAAAAVAGRALTKGHDTAYHNPVKRFLYMPFMHAEDMAAQNRCIELCTAAGDEEGVKYARIHAEIIEKFGRFPHRNKVLGRKTTQAEQAFLDSGGFAG